MGKIAPGLDPRQDSRSQTYRKFHPHSSAALFRVCSGCLCSAQLRARRAQGLHYYGDLSPRTPCPEEYVSPDDELDLLRTTQRYSAVSSQHHAFFEEAPRVKHLEYQRTSAVQSLLHARWWLACLCLWCVVRPQQCFAATAVRNSQTKK